MKTRSLLLGIPLVFSCHSASSNKSSPAEPLPPPLNTQPQFGPLVEQAEPPPPISGGTLAVDRKSGLAVAADPDRDRVFVVDLPMRTVRFDIPLAKHSEPGRVAIDDSGHAHVALRQSGELATIDLATGGVTLRKACTAPRGVTFDAKMKVLLVACATGDLLTFPIASPTPTTRTNLGRDIRDVIIIGDFRYVTRFRSAHIVAADSKSAADVELGPAINLAWRAIAAPDKDANGAEVVAVVGQDPTPEPVDPAPGGYGASSAKLSGDCTGVGIVSTRLFAIDHPFVGEQNQATLGSVRLPTAVLPVDVATNGREFVVVAAGNAFTPNAAQLFIVTRSQLTQPQECVSTIEGTVDGQAVAAAFDGDDQLIVQTREPATLQIMSEDRKRPWKQIVLSTESRADSGHEIFHSNAGNNLACASCHAEGADDGRTWEFVGEGPRRTPSLLGTTLHTEPYHWNGDMKDLSALVDHVFVERMGGPKLDTTHVDKLGHYLFALPSPPKLRTIEEVPARGKQLFQQRCSGCHNGPRLTNSQTVDVGTGGAFQVPSLVGVGWRAPFIHSGCATTLFDRFNPECGGLNHALTSDLARDQIADIVAYLETL